MAVKLRELERERRGRESVVNQEDYLNYGLEVERMRKREKREKECCQPGRLAQQVKDHVLKLIL